MRLRNVKNAKEILKISKYFVIDPMNNKSKWEEVFKNDKPIMLEVGMGKGDFIVGMAKKHPEWNFIGVEAQESVLVRAIEKLENEELDNVRVINIYAEALGEVFDCEIDTLFLNFSDPWPKTRHHKRRLTYETHLKVYDNLFKGDAKIELKTDNDGLFQDSLVYLSQYGYVLDEVILDLKMSGKDNVETEYEEKFSSLGFKIKYVRAHRDETYMVDFNNKNKMPINSKMKNKADELIKKSKELNLIKPLSDAFENTPCEKEVHRGKIK